MRYQRKGWFGFLCHRQHFQSEAARSAQIGYLQLETASALTNNRNNNFFNENSFTFDTTVVSNEKMEEVAAYVKKRVDEIKSGKADSVPTVTSPADEIKKYKELLDMGVISQEEFETKKKQLLNL